MPVPFSKMEARKAPSVFLYLVKNSVLEMCDG